MDMDVSHFGAVSMRGRVAFALMCLEGAIQHIDPAPERWLVVLDQLWKYTSDELLDTWQEATAEFIPGVILKYEKYVEKDFDYLSPHDFSLLQVLYCSSDPRLNTLADLVFTIGTVEMFGGLEDSAPESLRRLSQVLLLLREMGLGAPSVDLVSEYSFSFRHGWGSPFDAGRLRRFVARHPYRQ